MIVMYQQFVHVQTLASTQLPRHARLNAAPPLVPRPAPQGTDEEKAEAAAVLVAVLEAVRVVAVGLAPITPGLAGRIYQQLGYTPEQFEVG